MEYLYPSSIAQRTKCIVFKSKLEKLVRSGKIKIIKRGGGVNLWNQKKGFEAPKSVKGKKEPVELVGGGMQVSCTVAVSFSCISSIENI